MSDLSRNSFRYILAAAIIALAFLLRWTMVQAVGELPPFITFYPAVMLVALLAGLGPGILAAVLAVLVTDYFILTPAQWFFLETLNEGVSLGIFLASGLLMSIVAEWYRHARQKAATYEKELALRESREQIREQYANLLRRSNERLEVAKQAAGLGIWDWDIATGHIEWSPGMFALFGLDPETRAASFDAWKAVLHPDDISVASERIDRAIQEHALLNSEYRVARPDGRVRWISAMGKASYDEAGRAVRMAGVCMDVTDRRQAEEALKESEDRLRFALEVSNTGAWELDLADNTARRSLRHDQIFGYTALLPQWTYEMFLEHVLPEDREAVDHEFRRAVATRGDWSFECRIRCRDGQVRWIWAAGRCRADASGKPARMGGIVHDITDRKEAEVQLKAWNETLEKRVAERTAESQWRANQLQQLAAQMTQAEERERRRLAQVLHDHLQQLLVAAKIRLGGVVRRVQEEKTSTSIAEAIGLIEEAIGESRSLTKELSPPVLYDAGLAAGLEWLGRETEKKYRLPVAVQVEPDIEPDDLTTKVFVFQAARELILNAVKHAHASCLKVRLSSIDNDRLQVAVQDDGIGFDPEMMNQKESKGGFGLFSIRERLDVIGGGLTIASSPIDGTFATIIAPCRRPRLAELLAHAPAARAAAPTCDAFTRTDRIRVLLADDHPIVRKGIADMLMEHPDLNLLGEAGNGQEAVDKALELQPDVVLMDVTMPVMDGIEATRRIKEAAPSIRVIGLSMHERDDMALRMKEAGASDYLVKTGAAEDLIATILNQCPQA